MPAAAAPHNVEIPPWHHQTAVGRLTAWSYQPITRPDDMSSEHYRWCLIQDFIDRINEHRVNFFHPSNIVCVDESISRWYSLGGSWINKGLPHYVAIDQKPEDGCEIQDSCCGRSNIMMRLKLFKSATEEEALRWVRSHCSDLFVFTLTSQLVILFCNFNICTERRQMDITMAAMCSMNLWNLGPTADA